MKFSPISILVGVVLAVVAVVGLSPVGDHGASLALTAFFIGAGGWELGRRIRAGSAASPPKPDSEDKEA